MADLTKEEVQQIVAELLGEFKQGIQEQFDTHATRVGQLVEEKSTSWLDQLIDEAESFEDDEEDFEDDEEDEEFDDDEDEEDSEVSDRVQQQLIQLKRQNDAIAAQLAQEREQREAAEQKQRQDAMKAAALESLSKTGKVVNPHQLLTLLQTEGKLVERDGQLVFKGKDQYGDVFTPIDKGIDPHLESDYAHFAAARPGTGTGASQGSGTGGSGAGFRHLANGVPDPQTALALAKDPERRKEFLAEVAQAVQVR